MQKALEEIDARETIYRKTFRSMQEFEENSLIEQGIEEDISLDFDQLLNNTDKRSSLENSEPSILFSRRMTTDIKPIKPDTNHKPTEIKKGKTIVIVHQPTIKFEQLPAVNLVKARTNDERLREALDIFTY